MTIAVYPPPGEVLIHHLLVTGGPYNDVLTPEELDRLGEEAELVLELATELSTDFSMLYPRWVLLDQYYRGEPPMPTDPRRLTDKYRELLGMSRSNWCGLVVDVVNERLKIGSISSTQNPVQDKTAWSWWQTNNMDYVSPQIHSAALKFGLCYGSVWPSADPKVPKFMGESPMTCHVRWNAEADVAEAALRVWQDNVRHCVFADLTLPNYQFRLVSVDEVSQQLSVDYTNLPRHTVTVNLDQVRWTFRDDVPPVVRNRMGVVPYERFLTEPDLMGGYRSEIEGLIPIQDRIHKTNFDRLLAQSFASFPRAWITGIDVPTDPKTGKPREPFDAAVDRLWTIENEGAKVGQLDAAELDGYIKANTADVQALATQSRTPPHHFMSGMGIFPSGESVRATEYGLARKTQSRQQSYGDSHARLLRKGGLAVGNKRLANDLGLNVVWDDVEARSEGEIVDALLKMSNLGVPNAALWQRWGAKPEEITAWQEQLDAQNEAAEQNPPPQATPTEEQLLGLARANTAQ